MPRILPILYMAYLISVILLLFGLIFGINRGVWQEGLWNLQYSLKFRTGQADKRKSLLDRFHGLSKNRDV